MTRNERDEAEWHNPANWHAGPLGVYSSRRDSRSFVPKRRPTLGVTINFARPAGIVFPAGAIGFVVLVATLTRGQRR